MSIIFEESLIKLNKNQSIAYCSEIIQYENLKTRT